MQTETLDKLYLEWSQLTRARNARELAAAEAINTMFRAFANVMMKEPSDLQNEAWRTARKARDNLVMPSPVDSN